MAICNYMHPLPMREDPDPTPRAPDDTAPGRIGPRQFWAIFEHAHDAMWLVDEAQHIVAANPAACALCGLSRAELLRHRFPDLLAPAAVLGFQRVWQILPSQGHFNSEVQFRYADRALREAEVSATANFLPGQHLIVAHDITLQNWALAQVERQQARLAALRAVDRTRTTSRDLCGALDTILEQVTTHLPVDAAAVWVRHAPEPTLSYTAARGFDADHLDQLRRQAGAGIAAQALHEQRRIYIPDLAATPDRAPRSSPARGSPPTTALPLVANDQVQGVSKSPTARPCACRPKTWSSSPPWPARPPLPSTTRPSSATCSAQPGPGPWPTTPRSKAGRAPWTCATTRPRATPSA